MTDVITKVAIGGVEYPFAGGGSSGEEHEFITQAEYEQLTPTQKAEKVYMITGEGETPTPGGGTAVERGDMIFLGGNFISPFEGVALVYSSGYIERFSTNKPISGSVIYNATQYSSGHYMVAPIVNDNNFYMIAYVGGSSMFIHKINNDGTLSEIIEIGNPYRNSSRNGVKNDGGHRYYNCVYNNVTHYVKCDVEGNWEDITQQEYDAIPSGLYYKGLYYSQDGNDYVSVDSTGTEVKRYSEVGTINGIYNDKLYRTVGGVAYAIATI